MKNIIKEFFAIFVFSVKQVNVLHSENLQDSMQTFENTYMPSWWKQSINDITSAKNSKITSGTRTVTRNSCV